MVRVNLPDPNNSMSVTAKHQVRKKKLIMASMSGMLCELELCSVFALCERRVSLKFLCRLLSFQ
jgi:hypothetical protein